MEYHTLMLQRKAIASYWHQTHESFIKECRSTLYLGLITLSHWSNTNKNSNIPAFRQHWFNKIYDMF